MITRGYLSDLGNPLVWSLAFMWTYPDCLTIDLGHQAFRLANMHIVLCVSYTIVYSIVLNQLSKRSGAPSCCWNPTRSNPQRYSFSAAQKSRPDGTTLPAFWQRKPSGESGGCPESLGFQQQLGDLSRGRFIGV